LVSQFYFVYRYCGTTVQHCGMHCYLVSMATLVHVMSTMSSISIISIIYVGNLAWHLCVNIVLMWVIIAVYDSATATIIEEQMSNVTGT